MLVSSCIVVRYYCRFRCTSPTITGSLHGPSSRERLSNTETGWDECSFRTIPLRRGNTFRTICGVALSWQWSGPGKCLHTYRTALMVEIDVILLTLTLCGRNIDFKQDNPQRVSFDRTMVTVHWSKRRGPRGGDERWICLTSPFRSTEGTATSGRVQEHVLDLKRTSGAELEPA